VEHTGNAISVDFATTSTKLCVTRAPDTLATRHLSAGSARRPGKALEKDVETPAARWNIVCFLKTFFTNAYTRGHKLGCVGRTGKKIASGSH